MKKILHCLSALLSVLLLLSACAPEPGEADKGALSPERMGRYVEKAIPLPESSRGVLSLRTAPDGALELLIAQEDGVALYRCAQGALSRVQESWLQALNALPYNVEDIAFDAEGRPYALCSQTEGLSETGFTSGDYTVRMYLYRADDARTAFEEIPLSLGERNVWAYNLAVLEDGGFLLRETQVVHHVGPDGALLATVGDYPNGFAAHGGSYAIAQADGVHFYDCATDEEAGTAQVGFLSDPHSAVAADGEGNFYAASDGGLFRLSQSGGETERLLDGTLSSLSSPVWRVEQVARAADGGFFVLCQGNSVNASAVFAYTWSEETPAEPDKVLEVCALRPSAYLRQAAVAMQGLHPEVRVNIATTLGEEGPGTVSDAIKTINTALLAGKGADVYLLDNMPLQSYIDKGVLLDLSVPLGQHLAGGELLQNVAGAFGRDGKLYALPTRFGLPALWGSEALLQGAASLSSLADWAQAHPEPPLFYAMHPQNLIERFYASCAPLWLDEAGAIREEGFAAFLTDIKRLAGTAPGSAYDEALSGIDGSSETPAYYTGRCQSLVQELISVRMLPMSMAALDEQGGGAFGALPGQAENVFIPRNIVGINARAAQPELAQEYVGLLLSDEAQKYEASEYEGLPVNGKALQEMLDAYADQEDEAPPYGITYGFGFEDDTVIIPTGNWLRPGIKSTFLSLCRSADVPSLRDPVLLQMILDETRPFFEGGLSAEQAAAAVAARTQAYLTE